MKYTKKQIVKGFKNWEKHFRLQPSEFRSDLEELKEDIDSIAESKFEYLVKYMNSEE